VVRTSSREGVKDTAALLLTITRAVHEVDKEIPVAGGMSISEMIRTSNAAYLRRTTASLVGGFAVLALVLSVVGLYGVIAYSVAQRTREIGVRMALGASRQSVHTLILKEAGLLITMGIALGLILSVTAATLMRKLLFGTAVWDVSTLAGVAAVLGSAALVASYIPARRAARVNPIEALRAE
jgi:ABC-type antimicrobial peptide transport system permease subunit